jgi:hypothetical protein
MLSCWEQVELLGVRCGLFQQLKFKDALAHDHRSCMGE